MLHAVLVAAFAVSCGKTKPPSPTTLSASAIIIEAEGATANSPFDQAADRLASGENCLAVHDVSKDELANSKPAVCSITVKTAGTYRLWLRAWWQDGCGNSVAAAIDNGLPVTIGNDGTYQVWHWVRGPFVRLQPGAHELNLYAREAGARIDQVLLVDNADYTPSGIIGGSRPKAAPKEEPGLKPWVVAERPKKERFVVGINGAHGVGVEAMCIELGIPYVHVQQERLSELDYVKGFNVLWLACPEGNMKRIWPVLTHYVRDGGVLLVETVKMNSKQPGAKELLAPYTSMEMTAVSGKGVTIEGDDPVFFKSGAGKAGFSHPYSRFSPLKGAKGGEGVETFGKGNYRDDRTLGPALMRKKLGEGVVYLNPMSPGMSSMRNEKDFLNVCRAVLTESLRNRYQPMFTQLKWNPTPVGEVHLSDNFMRKPGEDDVWETLRGNVSLTGERKDDLSFALKASQDAMVVANRKDWKKYRVSAAVLAPGGAAGVWLTTNRGRRLALVFDGEKSSLTLRTENSEDSKTLLSKRVEGVNRGWRRLSLFQRDGRWRCWIDGAECFSIDAKDEDAAGPFGLLAPAGDVFFDSVQVRDVKALIRDQDTAEGEEGSPRAGAPFSTGMEIRSVFSPLWQVMPDPWGRHAVSLRLPHYAPAVFSLDGEQLGIVPSSNTEALVYLPEGRSPEHEIKVTCPLWRDYAFGSRLTDWYSTGNDWTKRERWACDRKWTYLGSHATDLTMLWHRRKLKAPYSLEVLLAPGMNRAYSKIEKARDLNLIIGGNGENIAEGYTFRTGLGNRSGCSLWHADTKLAENKVVGLPHGTWSVHHRWFMLKVIVDKERARFFFDGVQLFEQPLEPGEADGAFGVWTRNNAIRIGRATLSLSD